MEIYFFDEKCKKLANSLEIYFWTRNRKLAFSTQNGKKCVYTKSWKSIFDLKIEISFFGRKWLKLANSVEIYFWSKNRKLAFSIKKVKNVYIPILRNQFLTQKLIFHFLDEK